MRWNLNQAGVLVLLGGLPEFFLWMTVAYCLLVGFAAGSDQYRCAYPRPN